MGCAYSPFVACEEKNSTESSCRYLWIIKAR